MKTLNTFCPNTDPYQSEWQFSPYFIHLPAVQHQHNGV